MSLVVGWLITSVGPMTAAAAAATASSALHVSYRCDDGRIVGAVYPRDPTTGGATLTIGGRTIRFATALSADGGRYVANKSAHSRTHLQWWIKGDDATLSEGPFDNGDIIVNAKRTTTCHVTPKSP